MSKHNIIFIVQLALCFSLTIRTLSNLFYFFIFLSFHVLLRIFYLFSQHHNTSNLMNLQLVIFPRIKQLLVSKVYKRYIFHECYAIL